MTEAISRRFGRIREAVGPARELIVEIGYYGNKPAQSPAEERVVRTDGSETLLRFEFTQLKGQERQPARAVNVRRAFRAQSETHVAGREPARGPGTFLFGGS